MFDSNLFEQNLATTWVGRNLYCFEELASTNSYAKKMEIGSRLHGTIILADNQTKGRGQHERKWEAEPGANLTFSLIFEPRKNERFTLLTLACALAVSCQINQIAGVSTRLKWPNDILYKEKKMCGILTETQFVGNHLERIIVGIGLNVNQQSFNRGVCDTATSLALITSQTFAREKLLADIALKIENTYRMWSQYNPDLVRQVNHALVGYGEWVKLVVNNNELDGKYKFLGVNEAGALVTLNEDLGVKTFAFEQVRVKVMK